MKKKGLIAIVIFVAFAVFAVVKLVSNKKILSKGKEVVDRSHIPIAVNVEDVKMMEMNSTISRPSVVQPNEVASIAATMPGRLSDFKVELGSKVSKGQTIGKVDTKTYDIQLQNLQLAVGKFERDYKRNKELYEGNALSESNYLDSKFAYESRKLEMEQLQQQINDSYIKSPISGTIIDKRNLSGEFIGAGNPIATVVDVDLLKIYVALNESEVRFVKLNQEVAISASVFPDKNFRGKVTYISPSTDENFNYKVEIQARVKENPALKAGTYVTVLFETNTKDMALQIPKKALVEGVKNAYVYVQNGDKAEKRIIKVGRENGNYIEVISGLKEGEKVVVDGQINIVDNSLIQTK
jgi:RND family efflux transporter MFP subunit